MSSEKCSGCGHALSSHRAGLGGNCKSCRCKRVKLSVITDEERAERALLAEMPASVKDRDDASRLGYATFNRSAEEVCEAFIAGYLAALKERAR